MNNNNIVNHKHIFKIGNEEIELLINCKNGYWTSEIIKGDTGTAGSYGGNYQSLNEYIKEQEKQHRYSFNFFNHGGSFDKNAL